MQAGKLRHKVQFQMPVSGSDGFSDAVTGWVNATTNPVAAGLRPASAKEVQAAGGKIMQTDLTVELRYNKTLAAMDNHWRMQSGADTYEVLAAYDPDMKRRRFLVHVRKQVV